MGQWHREGLYNQRLERIVSAYLDLAEDRAERHIPMTMEDWSKRLALFLMTDDREVLPDRLFMSDFDKYMLELEESAKKLQTNGY